MVKKDESSSIRPSQETTPRPLIEVNDLEMQIRCVDTVREFSDLGSSCSDSSIKSEQPIHSKLSSFKSHEKILIVDDEPYNLMGLKVIINAADEGSHVQFLIDEAINGLEAYYAI